MAARKETIWQNDFSFGVVREEAVERDDTDLIGSSLKEALNTVVTATGQVKARPGLAYVDDCTASYGVEIDMGSDRVFDLHITPTGVEVRSDSATVFSNASTTWTALSSRYGDFTFANIRFWVLSDPDTSTVLIGSRHTPIYGLALDDAGSWTFGAAAFNAKLSGALAQPYWRYYPDVTIQPSARTGSITVTASSSIWTSAFSGMRIRFVDQEIVLGSIVSGTVINATVTETLPPTYDIVVASATGYKKGDVVEHSILGGQGIITGISGTTITVLATSSYDGFDATSSPKLVAPNAAQVISSVTPVSPAASFLWDMQMQSPVHGYAGWAARHKSRTYLCAFPGAPTAYAAGAAGGILDFTIGTNDGDGFVETIGSDYGGTLRYIISAEDLLFLTTKGLYYQVTRDGSAITPATIGPVSFSRIGCANVVPVVVDDGCVFVDAVGKNVHAALLAGDVYRSWRAQSLVRYCPEFSDVPVALGATTYGTEGQEQFVYVVTADGGAWVCQWDRDQSRISWRPWQTDGSFVCVYQCLGKSYAIIDRSIADMAVRSREVFTEAAVLDSMESMDIPLGAGVDLEFPRLAGHVCAVYYGGWDLGDVQIDVDGAPVDADGNLIDFPADDYTVQVGLPFSITVRPWPRRSQRTQWGTREVKRIVSFFTTVQDTGPIMVDGKSYGGYRIGDDVSVPPALLNDQIKTIVDGDEAFSTIPIEKDRPGPFTILKIGQRVVI